MTIGRIRVQGRDAGSGFALAPRLVVTAGHLVRGRAARELEFAPVDGDALPVSEISSDDDRDIALLRLEEDTVVRLSVGRSRGEVAWKVDSRPRGNDPRLTGTITDARRRIINSRGKEVSVLQLQVSESLGDYAGYSGSPVQLRSNDAVIGVLVEQLYLRLPPSVADGPLASTVLYAIPIDSALEGIDLLTHSVSFASDSNSATDAASMPAQLPHGLSDFTGRVEELNGLHTLLTRGSDADGDVRIITITGTAGVGKTVLAIHWAHQIRSRFPDGQLYVNLRGFDPAAPRLEPSEAIRGFLDAFSVPPQRIPMGFQAQEALYRSLLASRRVLVVLDNAAHASQVRPLLPGARGSLVLVTSRDHLAGLAVTEGARSLVLDLFDAGEAHQLLGRRLGGTRTRAEPEAVAEIIRLCARLPLALAIVAARAADHPEFSLKVLANELLDAGRDLTVFGGGDEIADVRSVFSWSYQRLSTPAGRLFRLLGVHPGPDIGLAAAARLAGISTAQALASLEELARAHLIEERVPQRFTFHDLLRAYAVEQSQIHDAASVRRAAERRALHYYLHTAIVADKLLDPYSNPQTLTPPRWRAAQERLADQNQALAWFAAEQAVLVAAVGRAANSGLDRDAWKLAATLANFLDRRGHWHESATTQSLALAATRRLGDRDGQ
ncbi:MAG TPA: NB-ARC domain-containing protein, partial [Propionibacteriaceae bacterium]|nr:NB-ARC domain-containing protein [Propionibacteriaceae bacterium]